MSRKTSNTAILNEALRTRIRFFDANERQFALLEAMAEGRLLMAKQLIGDGDLRSARHAIATAGRRLARMNVHLNRMRVLACSFAEVDSPHTEDGTRPQG